MKDTFKRLDDPGILENYDVIKISGGEPTLCPSKIQSIQKWARTGAKVYMYSNGADIDVWVKFYEDGGWGVTYSPHTSIDWEACKRVRAHGFPLRVHLKSGVYEEHIITWLTDIGCTVDLWTEGVCDTVPEDRWDASELIF